MNVTQILNNTSPTTDQFTAYQAAYDYFNSKLFDNKLKRCFLNFSRQANTLGFFSYKRWCRDDQQEFTHEISLNPDYLLTHPIDDVLSTLVHEMTHQWQFDFGKPSKNGYHNKEWAGMMETIGLMPSNTGQPGGKRTGYKVSDYIVKGGKFESAFQQIPTNYLIPWKGRDFKKISTQDKPRKDKLKYSCPGCRLNVWGKSGLNLLCGNCHLQLLFLSK